MAAWRRLGGALAAALILVLDCTPSAHRLLSVPAVVTLAVGQTQAVRLDVPGAVAVRTAGGPASLLVDGAPPPAGGRWRTLSGQALELRPERVGLYRLDLRLFGFLPWRAMRVQAVDVPAVAPGGQSVGIVLRAVGPLVVRLDPVASGAGVRPSPAAAGGLRVGDYVLAVDGRPVAGVSALEAAVQASGGRALAISALRAGQAVEVSVRPDWDPRLGRYLLGAWVRDQASGIGTLTFAEPSGGEWGALGHPVTDPTTGAALAPAAGWLLNSVIAGLQPSRDGTPGEKEGVLVGGQAPLGTVSANTAVGVFGRLASPPPPDALVLPIALEDQVHTGPAEMWTVLRGNVLGAFAVRITAVLPQRRPSGKGLVLRVTDPRLLAETGGIVQGMSGSPIIQDGRLVGAVTHVLVDDPSRGYGVLALWMAERAGLTYPPPVSAATAKVAP